MSCKNCNPIYAIRKPGEKSVFKASGLICPECKGHEWVRLAKHDFRRFCKRCNVQQREDNTNAPCVGKPPWAQ